MAAQARQHRESSDARSRVMALLARYVEEGVSVSPVVDRAKASYASVAGERRDSATGKTVVKHFMTQ